VPIRDVTAEGHQIFDNLVAILAAAGVGLTEVVRVGIVMRDLQRGPTGIQRGLGAAFR